MRKAVVYEKMFLTKLSIWCGIQHAGQIIYSGPGPFHVLWSCISVKLLLTSLFKLDGVLSAFGPGAPGASGAPKKNKNAHSSC
jgi:hypothetical protein